MPELSKNALAARMAELLAEGMTSKKLRDIVLGIHAHLDSPKEWSAETLEHIAQLLTGEGFVIRDPNDTDAFEG